MAEKDNGVFIRCYRTGNPDVLQVPGMEEKPCYKCGFSIWIAPSGIKLVEKWKAHIVCDICEPLDEDCDLQIIPLNRDQIEEIQDGLWNRKTRN